MGGVNKDLIADYEETVHSWVMSNGGSNQNGRISKSFFDGRSKTKIDHQLPFDLTEGDFEDHSWLRDKKLTIIAVMNLIFL